MADPFHRAIERHWRDHRPRMVQALEASGKLHAALEYAAERTADEESALIRNGMSPTQAQDLMREEWAFLPSEQDMRHLPNGGPEVWLAHDEDDSLENDA